MRPTSRPYALLVLGFVLGAAALAFASSGAPAPAAASAPAQATGAPCTSNLDKTAAPPEIQLGDTVTVTLKVNGSCPSVERPADIILVIDRSRSMERDNKLELAKSAAVAFVRRTDPALERIGLVAFSGSPVLVRRLTSDQDLIVQDINAIQNDPGTNIVDALEEGRQAVTGADARPGATKVIVFLTDGQHTTRQPPISDLDRVVADVRADGIVVYAIGLGNDVDPATLARMATSAAHVYRSPTAADLEQIYLQIAQQIVASVLFRTAQITDRVPANMDYIAGSGLPFEPTVSPDGKTLGWSLTDVKEPGFELAYRLRPQQVGTWPTNVSADLSTEDGFGFTDRQDFPVPTVRVLGGDPPVADCVCTIVRQRVPQDVIEDALTHPERYYGWRYPLDPGKPPSRANPPRECLTLQNVNIDYHPMWNTPIWRVGCP